MGGIARHDFAVQHTLNSMGWRFFYAECDVVFISPAPASIALQLNIATQEYAAMSEPTFEQKQDHYHKIRRSNYLASLRLEGFDTQPADVDKPLPTREAVLAKYRKTPH
ncbi:hypothetical protein ALQ35_01001 [Pseudomonas fluorescens]|nr:hypothetical protein ALQ35_01001 [Pseudomonas fluorescens]